MGDRCTVNLRVSRETWEQYREWIAGEGFGVDAYGCDDCPDTVVALEGFEINYAGEHFLADWARTFAFIGEHDAGGSYGAYEFVSNGRGHLLQCPTAHDMGCVVACNWGIADKRDIRRNRRFHALYVQVYADLYGETESHWPEEFSERVWRCKNDAQCVCQHKYALGVFKSRERAVLKRHIRQLAARLHAHHVPTLSEVSCVRWLRQLRRQYAQEIADRRAQLRAKRRARIAGPLV